MKTHLTLTSGYDIPTIGLGTWKAPGDTVPKAIEVAIKEAKYRHIDCAAAYGNEAQIGAMFAKLFQQKVVTRPELFVTSKLWNTAHHPDRVAQACRQTLKDLQLEYLDLYLIHWGIAFKPSIGPEPRDAHGEVKTEPVSIQDTWRAMEKLVDEGLVRSIGVSNFTVPMLIDLQTYARIKPAMNQVELHPYLSQTGLVEYCHNHKIAVTAYSPLGSAGENPRLLGEPVIASIAKEHGVAPAQVLLNWSVNRNVVTIPKSTNSERIKQNIAIYDFKLSRKQVAQIDALNRNHRYVNPTDWLGLEYFG